MRRWQHSTTRLVEDVAAHYGALKAACEREVQAAFGANALLVRPGLIVGPFDPTGRFTYWPQRVAAGGESWRPGSRSDPVQFIDVRDLAEWIVRALTRGPGGAYNATGPATPWHFGAFLSGCIKALAVDPPPTLTWCSERFLLDQGVTPWTETAAVGAGRRAGDPSGLDPARARYRAGIPTAGGHRDRHAGMGAVAAVRAPAGAYANVGLSGRREAELLAAWHAQGDADAGSQT
jgi:2'-hydroxyisoflavone reductase